MSGASKRQVTAACTPNVLPKSSQGMAKRMCYQCDSQLVTMQTRRSDMTCTPAMQLHVGLTWCDVQLAVLLGTLGKLHAKVAGTAAAAAALGKQTPAGT